MQKVSAETFRCEGRKKGVREIVCKHLRADRGELRSRKNKGISMADLAPHPTMHKTHWKLVGSSAQDNRHIGSQ